MRSTFTKNVKIPENVELSRCLIGAQKNHLGLSRSPSGPEFRDLAAGTPPGPQNPAKNSKIKKSWISGYMSPIILFGVTAGVIFSGRFVALGGAPMA